MRVGATATIDDVCLRVEKITADGERIVAFDQDVDVYAGGSMPLPPYLNRPSDETDACALPDGFCSRARGRGCAYGWSAFYLRDFE